ncbi:Protease prsW family protein [Austwickia chelonae]|uniref:PrsW family intramembrane metalloprotease n=1 Tax=Austwickia chelonae NBRC 105200 TaxID=1184607 RepID=K6V9D0_9MICO|nr:PrsW family intramembrane metalloprotease [Austwickia chelonae]GAB78848.1 hypothetical protein AUCHE_17_00600 [Austwickia chelonae NBRC 105200]SEV85253.1 Protease prsW family protein [Austwickia chelonae]
MFAAFIGGATTAVYPALKGNDLYGAFLLNFMSEENALGWKAALSGPTTEEWTKMTCTLVIMLIAKDTMTRPMHGLVVGASTGLGFQIMENISYGVQGSINHLQGDLTQPLTTGITRFLTGFSSHNLYSAISGVGVAILLGRTLGGPWSRSRRITGFVGLCVLPWFLHFSWNAIGAFTPPLSLIIAVVSTIVSFIVFALVLRWVWRQERLYLTEAATQVTGNKLTELHQAAIGTRKTRKTYLKQLKKTHGKTAAKTAHTDMHTYLEHLQAWARRHTGIDEHTYPTPTPTTPNPLDDDTLYLTPVGSRS